MFRVICGLVFRAVIICVTCIYATQFIKMFYDELNKEVYEMNKSVNAIYKEVDL